MTRKRFKKLLMGDGFSRDEAELMAGIAQLCDKENKHPRFVSDGMEFCTTGYAFYWFKSGGLSTGMAALMAGYRRLVTHG